MVAVIPHGRIALIQGNTILRRQHQVAGDWDLAGATRPRTGTHGSLGARASPSH